MTNKEYWQHVSAALLAVVDGCAKYMQKNPNAKYKDGNGKESPISFALDIARIHAQNLREVSEDAGAD